MKNVRLFVGLQLSLWVSTSMPTPCAKHLGPRFCRQSLCAAQQAQAGEEVRNVSSALTYTFIPSLQDKGRVLVPTGAGCLLSRLPARGWQMFLVCWSCVALATGLGAVAAARRKHSVRLS